MNPTAGNVHIGASLGEADLKECLKQLDSCIGYLHDSLKPGTLMMICTGHGNTTFQRHKEVSLSFLHRLCCVFLRS